MNLVYTSRFKKDFKRMMNRNKDETKLKSIINKLLEKKSLEPKNRCHPLYGIWRNKQECHIEPDWLLIYQISGDDLILARTGSHSDLFE